MSPTAFIQMILLFLIATCLWTAQTLWYLA